LTLNDSPKLRRGEQKIFLRRRVELKLTKISLIAAIATIAPTAFADGTGIYVLGSLGDSQPHMGQSTFDGHLGNAGATNVGSTWDDNDWGWKAQIGYQFDRNFAVEGGYVNLGQVNYNAAYSQGAATGNYQVDGWNIAGLGILPLDDSFSLFGKLGAIDARTTAELSGSGLGGVGNGQYESTRWRPDYGFGGMYNLTKNTALRLEYERFDGVGDPNTTGQTNIDLVSLGVSHQF
jgi:OOP family OmpA-OmpF porin